MAVIDVVAGPAGRTMTGEEAPEKVEHEFEARLADSSALAFRVAFSVLRHHQDAEDVAQDAFLRAHRAFRRLRDRDRFRAWLVRVAWRLALDRRRGDVRRVARESIATVPDGPPSSEDEVIARERSERLWRAIDRLPEKLRMALVLSAIEEHGVRDVAALLRIPEGTVKSRLFDARRRLQELLTCTTNPSTRR
jgi:RNA polymerase sigma-70 factor (ECF subfamily)